MFFRMWVPDTNTIDVAHPNIKWHSICKSISERTTKDKQNEMSVANLFNDFEHYLFFT